MQNYFVIAFQANISVDLPLLILGVLGIVGGILALFLPETLDQELPQTLQDGENFGMGQKIWDFPCVKKYDWVFLKDVFTVFFTEMLMMT